MIGDQRLLLCVGQWASPISTDDVSSNREHISTRMGTELEALVHNGRTGGNNSSDATRESAVTQSRTSLGSQAITAIAAVESSAYHQHPYLDGDANRDCG